jgi:nucleotide-binding universal stress UspA family protein
MSRLVPVDSSRTEFELHKVRHELEKRLPSDARDRCSVETRVEIGEPYREILNVAKETRANLLVMNIHGKGGLERALLGSTAERVMRGATCPVMAIPPMKKRGRAA